MEDRIKVVTMRVNRRLLLPAILALVDTMFHFRGHALVVTLSAWYYDATQQTQLRVLTDSSIAKQPQQLELTIRSTTHQDISAVSTMLSLALLEERDKDKAQGRRPSGSAFSFKRKMEFLKTKSSMTSLLQARMEAITTGKRLWQLVSKVQVEELHQSDKLRFLWSHDSFRSKLERACRLSDEHHTWKDYNFACAPQTTDSLFHKMITAENAATGDVVGFCEVAMLSRPNYWHSEWDTECETDDDPIPTIVNLVISNEYRRRGIASSILKSAARYVQQTSYSKELALFVEQNNDGAVRMYNAFGFKTVFKNRNQLYMMSEV